MRKQEKTPLKYLHIHFSTLVTSVTHLRPPLCLCEGLRNWGPCGRADVAGGAGAAEGVGGKEGKVAMASNLIGKA